MRHGTTNVDDESKRIWEDEVMYYFKVSPGNTEENYNGPNQDR
jgi:hypothetical protein